MLKKRMINLSHLRYFFEVARHEHITRASKSLAISASSLSHAIQSLESELNCSLFEKRGKNIYLTSSGRILYEKTERYLRDFEMLLDEVRVGESSLSGKVRIASSHFLAESLVTPSWLKLQSKNPKLFGEIYTVRSSEGIQSVLQGNADVAFCFSPQTHPQLWLKKLYSGQMAIYVRESHPILKYRKNLNSKFLNQYPAVFPKAFQGIEVCEAHPELKRHKIFPSVINAFDNYHIAIECLLNSESWSLLPDWIARSSGKNLIPISFPKWNAPYTIQAATRRPAPSKIINQLTSACKELLGQWN